MQLENVIYRVIHNKKIAVSFAEHPQFLKTNELYVYTLGE